MGIITASPYFPRGYVAVDTREMTDEQRAAGGYHYGPKTGQWYAPDDGAGRLNEQSGRYRDTSFPGWSYDQYSGARYQRVRVARCFKLPRSADRAHGESPGPSPPHGH